MSTVLPPTHNIKLPEALNINLFKNGRPQTPEVGHVVKEEESTEAFRDKAKTQVSLNLQDLTPLLDSDTFRPLERRDLLEQPDRNRVSGHDRDMKRKVHIKTRVGPGMNPGDPGKEPVGAEAEITP
eukprot:14414558-Alexandrium_andersonii.AAC.1